MDSEISQNQSMQAVLMRQLRLARHEELINNSKNFQSIFKLWKFFDNVTTFLSFTGLIAAIWKFEYDIA